MPRAFPVPVYTTTASSPAPFSALKRALSASSPGTSDSTASVIPGALLSNGYYVTPEGSAAQGDLATPAPVTRGWLLPASSVAGAGNRLRIAAGTWTLPVHYSRASGLLTGNVGLTLTAILLRVSADASTNLQEIGRVTGAGITATTTEQVQTLNISGAAVELEPGENIMLVLHADKAAQLLATDSRIHTNSTTALRITAAPAFTLLYTRGLNDSAPADGALARTVAYARGPSDSAPVGDALGRVVTMPRSIADSAGAVADNVARRATYGRRLNDSAPTADQAARQLTASRALADSAPTADQLGRQAGYGRSLSDGAGTVTDALGRIVTANRSLSDAAGSVGDDLDRAATYGRSAADSPAVSDSLNRAVIYARALTEALSEGGGINQPLPPGLLRLRPSGRVEAVNTPEFLPDAHIRLVARRECIEAVETFEDRYRLYPRNGATLEVLADRGIFTVQHLQITEGPGFYSWEC